MSAEDELRAAAREQKDELDAARARDEALLTRREAARRAALARADSCGAELDEVISAFLKLMRQAGNLGSGRLWANKRQKGWRVVDTYSYEHGATIWVLSKSGEWDLVNGPKGSSRQVLRELVEQRFRNAHASVETAVSSEWVDGQTAAMKQALAQTLATNGVT
jgi:hypothetical protein